MGINPMKVYADTLAAMGQDPALAREDLMARGGENGEKVSILGQYSRDLTKLAAEGKLGTYLAQLDEQANAMLELLIRQMAEREDVTEQLKANDQMEWVRLMNSIRNRAEEIVNNDLIYV